MTCECGCCGVKNIMVVFDVHHAMKPDTFALLRAIAQAGDMEEVSSLVGDYNRIHTKPKRRWFRRKPSRLSIGGAPPPPTDTGPYHT